MNGCIHVVVKQMENNLLIGTDNAINAQTSPDEVFKLHLQSMLMPDSSFGILLHYLLFNNKQPQLTCMNANVELYKLCCAE